VSQPRGLKVVERAVYRGPHVYGPTPMVRARLDLGALEAHPSDRLPGFGDKLLHLLPSLQRHACSLGRAGGFVERLREGTWLGHVTELVAIELQSLAGCEVKLGKTRSVKGRPGVYDVLVEYREEEVARLALRLALELVEHLLPEDLRGVDGLDLLHADGGPRPFDLPSALAQLRRLERRVAFGPPRPGRRRPPTRAGLQPAPAAARRRAAAAADRAAGRRRPAGRSMHEVRLHLLTDGDSFDLRRRRPKPESAGGAS
jgi:cyanophycin synthetase